MIFLRNIRLLLACAALAMAAFCAGSCTENLEPPRGSEFETDVVLHLNTGSTPSYTRADGKDSAEADPYAAQNEEAIRRVDLFFFKSDADGNRMEGEDEDLFYVYEVKCENFTSADVSVKLPVELAEKFTFVGSEDGYRAYVYALVNLPATIGIDEEKKTVGGKKATYDVLQELWVSTTAFTEEKNGPSDFVMRGGSPITMVKQGRYFTASGTIMLERLASKIRLWAAIPERIYVDPETGKTIVRDQYGSDGEYENALKRADIWEPVTTDHDPDNGTEMSTVGLYLYNLTTNGRIDGSVSAGGLAYANIDRDPKYEEVVRRLETIRPPADGQQIPESIYEKNYPYTHTLAYYSYPNVWVNSASEDNHQTYLMIRLPWRKQIEGGGFEIQNFYYQVPVNVLKSNDGRKENCLESNRYYRTKIKIGMLGSKDMGDPLEVDASCEVVPWQTADVDVSIKGRRYLVVNQTEWTMNNTWTLEIPFSSSHPVEIVDCYVTYFRYKDLWGTADYTNGTHNYTEFGNWLDKADKLPGGRGGEGKIESDFTTYAEVEERIKGGAAIGSGYRDKVITHKNTYLMENEILYYKHKYFYDDILLDYTYYVGHEHPITFHDEGIAFPKNVELPEKERKAWEEYKRKYNDIDSVYTYSVDNSRNVIKFSHPLVQWTPVRDEKLRSQSGESLVGATLGTAYYSDERTYDISRVKYYYPLCDDDYKLKDEFSRYEITIMVKHAGYSNSDDLFRDTIHITQYPGMYIEVSHNYGGAKGKLTADGKYTSNAYTKVNGKSIHTDSQWDDVNELDDFSDESSNVNPNMYVIYTTQLEEDKQDMYIIGDPRMLNYNNDLHTGADPDKGNGLHGYDSLLVDSPKDADKWSGRNDSNGKKYENYPIAEAKTIYHGEKNKLTHYYPTDESSGVGSKENFIAPAFRIASSFGKVSINGRTEMRRRCAAYQEAGRPAGRWRLPTKAEVMYIATLSAEGKIPVLFGSVKNKTDDGYYWCAQGGLTVNGAGKCEENTYGDLTKKNNGQYSYPPGSMAVRCVYDEWYWTQIDGGEFPKGLSATTTEFYWGDKEKDNPQAPAPTVLHTPSHSTKK